jgi:hypothetical protein
MPDSPRKNEDLKRAHELAVAERLVDFLRAQGHDVSDPRPGDISRREPDALCDVDGSAVGIEVACAYYDREEARDTWSIARGHPEQSKRLQQPGESLRETVARSRVLVNFDQSLAGELNRTLHVHAAKTYSVPTYLVLDAYRAHAPLTTDRDAETIFAGLLAPRCLRSWRSTSV